MSLNLILQLLIEGKCQVSQKHQANYKNITKNAKTNTLDPQSLIKKLAYAIIRFTRQKFLNTNTYSLFRVDFYNF